MHQHKKSTGKCYLGYNSLSHRYHDQYQRSGKCHVWRSYPMEQYSRIYRVCILIIVLYHATQYPWTISLWSRYTPRHKFQTEIQVDVAKEEKAYQL